MSTLQSVRIKQDRKINKKYSVRILESKLIASPNADLNKCLTNSKTIPDYSKVLTESLIEEYENEDQKKRKSERDIEIYYQKDNINNKNVNHYFKNKFITK